MKRILHRTCQLSSFARLLALGFAIVSSAAPVTAQITAVPKTLNYQGRLATPGGNPVPNGTYSIRFSLWNVASGGTVAANEKWNQTISNVQVRNGVFAVSLNVSTGAADKFNGNLWLEVKIGADAALSPRTPLVTVPYAMKSDLALTVPDGSITNAKIAVGTLTADRFASGVLTGWLLGGNAGTTTSQFLGTTDAKPIVFKANNRQVMRYTDVVDSGNTLHAVNVLGGAATNSIAAGVIGATIAGGGFDSNTGSDSLNDIRGNFGFIGGGGDNFIDAFTHAVIAGGSANIAQGSYSVIGGGRSNNTQSDDVTISGGNSNAVFGVVSTIGGGSNNSINASYATISGGESNSSTGSASFTGGGSGNTNGGLYGTISGGYFSVNSGEYGTVGGGALNEVSGSFGTVAGGYSNDALGAYAAAGGGISNVASGGASTIAGGDRNTVNGLYTTIGGGGLNYGWSVSDYSTIGGGYSNTVYGDYATVPGGYLNDADGIGSFAAGIRAYAAHGGSFVWADNHDQDFISTADNQFCIRATGGIVFEAFTNVPFYSGVGTTEANRYFLLLNSPRAPSASGLKAGGILCADSFNYANPGKNNMAVKGTLGVGYPDPAPYVAAFNGNTYSSGSYLSSDARYKKNVATLNHALDNILSLRGVSYEWDKVKHPNQNFGDGKQMGMIAQEVEKIFPHLVVTAPDGYKAVNYVGVVPVLVEAVKTLNARTVLQQKDNEALKTENAELRVRLERIEAAITKLQNNGK